MHQQVYQFQFVAIGGVCHLVGDVSHYSFGCYGCFAAQLEHCPICPPRGFCLTAFQHCIACWPRMKKGRIETTTGPDIEGLK
eukprot:2939449-Amphidinium_carterae.1